jgi:hypothetical protein
MDSKIVFQLQKKVVRFMTGAKSSISYKPLLRALEILALPSQYELSLMPFLVHNLEYLTFNFSVHSINTRKKVQLHRQVANFSSYQRDVYCSSKRFLIHYQPLFEN